MKSSSIRIFAAAAILAAVVFQAREARATSICTTVPGNLVQNCSFDTGTTADWTLTRAVKGPGFSIIGNLFGFVPPYPGSAYTANFYATVGPTGDYANYESLSQTLTTISGQEYDLTFYLQNPDGDPDSIADFVVDWDGNQVADLGFSTADYGQYAEYSYLVLGTGTDTLSFAGWDSGGAYILDDVSVAPAATPEPSVIVLLLTGLAAISWRKLRAQTSLSS